MATDSTGATFGVVTVNALLTEAPEGSVAVMVTVQLPMALGTPLSTRELALKAIHAGRPVAV
ncbi:MAG: hypothetical protein BGO36_08250 [Burkholderiales bacterium 68-10]|nr:MAG: hypothetical protein BGO36_08250 [Burkholderiales bacterium 68-10]